MLSAWSKHMQVVVQNGSNLSLRRAKADAVVDALPDTLSSVAKQLLLCRSAADDFRVTFHSKERIIALNWPKAGAAQPDNSFVLTELITCLAAIAESGDLPGKLKTSVVQRLRDEHAGTISTATDCTAD
jgi:hypothetical protein